MAIKVKKHSPSTAAKSTNHTSSAKRTSTVAEPQYASLGPHVLGFGSLGYLVGNYLFSGDNSNPIAKVGAIGAGVVTGFLVHNYLSGTRQEHPDSYRRLSGAAYGLDLLFIGAALVSGPMGQKVINYIDPSFTPTAQSTLQTALPTLTTTPSFLETPGAKFTPTQGLPVVTVYPESTLNPAESPSPPAVQNVLTFDELCNLPVANFVAAQPATPGICIKYFQDTTEKTAYYVALADLRDPKISFLVTPKNTNDPIHPVNTQTTLDFYTSMKKTFPGLELVINGGGFAYGQNPTSLIDTVCSNGDCYSKPQNGVLQYESPTFITFKDGSLPLIIAPPYSSDNPLYNYASALATAKAIDWSNVSEAISGNTSLLINGNIHEGLNNPNDPGCLIQCARPRTAIGLNADKTVAYFLVVDGGQTNYSDGMTLPQVAQLLKELGVSDAINLDGGSSSSMVLDGTYINHPVEKIPVGTHVGIIYKP